MPPGRHLPRGLRDAGRTPGVPSRDCGAKRPTALAAPVADAGPKAITTGSRLPRRNPRGERRLPTC
ncbi:hypothetical protein GCM10027162_55440 [Streptomyces incanus]